MRPTKSRGMYLRGISGGDILHTSTVELQELFEITEKWQTVLFVDSKN